KLNGRTNFSVLYDRSELDPEGGSKDTFNQINFNLNRNLSPETSISLVANASERTSDDTAREFSEYGVGIALVRNF
ncbi:MAG: hypothetical protein OQK12_04060, partial [Motiliproteus sp.]|nr:hypothetical protein [Motiliproteus sp.]